MKNVKSFICNTVALLVSVLYLIFMGQPGVGLVQSLSLGGIETSNTVWTSGYNLINFSSNDGKATALAVGLLIATILACVLILTSIYGILRSFNVVKANNADKIVRWVNVSVTSLFVVFMSLALIMAICIVADFNSKVEVLLSEKIGWGLVINFVLSIVSLVAICFDKGAKKASKSKKK